MACSALSSHASSHASSVVRTSNVRKTVVCAASSRTGLRRAIVGGLFTLPFVALPESKAILLDEDDEEMIERAKANRKARLASQKETTREFLKSEGLNNAQLNKELIPVQKAIYKLAKSGSQLEAGDVSGAAATLSGNWVSDFKQATEAFPSASADLVLSSLSALQAAAASSNLKESKQEFVLVASALELWAEQAGVASSLKGL